jgi:hypothetical protein
LSEQLEDGADHLGLFVIDLAADTQHNGLTIRACLGRVVLQHMAICALNLGLEFISGAIMKSVITYAGTVGAVLKHGQQSGV